MHNRNLTAIVTLALLVGCMIGCSNPYTPAGHEGYVFERPRVFGKGGFRGVINGPGNYGVSAFRNQVINIDLRPQTYSETFKILAKDDLNVAFQVHAVLSIQGGGHRGGRARARWHRVVPALREGALPNLRARPGAELQQP